MVFVCMCKVLVNFHYNGIHFHLECQNYYCLVRIAMLTIIILWFDWLIVECLGEPLKVKWRSTLRRSIKRRECSDQMIQSLVSSCGESTIQWVCVMCRLSCYTVVVYRRPSFADSSSSYLCHMCI